QCFISGANKPGRAYATGTAGCQDGRGVGCNWCNYFDRIVRTGATGSKRQLIDSKSSCGRQTVRVQDSQVLRRTGNSAKRHGFNLLEQNLSRAGDIVIEGIGFVWCSLQISCAAAGQVD